MLIVDISTALANALVIDLTIVTLYYILFQESIWTNCKCSKFFGQSYHLVHLIYQQKSIAGQASLATDCLSHRFKDFYFNL